MGFAILRAQHERYDGNRRNIFPHRFHRTPLKALERTKGKYKYLISKEARPKIKDGVSVRAAANESTSARQIKLASAFQQLQQLEEFILGFSHERSGNCVKDLFSISALFDLIVQVRYVLNNRMFWFNGTFVINLDCSVIHNPFYISFLQISAF